MKTLKHKGVSMATGSQIYKASINLANLNTHYYDDISLTFALHPSETEERMMYRLLAFLYNAHERLELSEGLANPDQPDIWQKDLRGDIEHWIDLGQPDEKRIKKACSKSELVSIFTYQPSKASTWIEKTLPKIKNNKKVNIFSFTEVENGPLEIIAERTMSLNCVIEDENVFLGNNSNRVHISVIGH